MIFNSREMEILRNKFNNLPDYKVPSIILLDRFDGYSNERGYLEELILQVKGKKRRDWIRRLVSVDNSEHLGAWFEIMLYGWLLSNFDTVAVEPIIEGNLPDFLIDTPFYQIAIEAKALSKTKMEQDKNRNRGDVFRVLESINMPFIITLRFIQSGDNIDSQDIFFKVKFWLSSNAQELLSYEDDFGNKITISATFHPECAHVIPTSIESFFINSDVLKTRIWKKASQHKKMQLENIPYILAFLIERTELSSEEVVEAFLGRTSITYDIDSNVVVSQKCDQNGIIFGKDGTINDNVSGILVFRKNENLETKSRFLKANYIQNPYARIEISPSLFPIESKYVVINHNVNGFEMGWV